MNIDTNTILENKDQSYKAGMVHFILSHSYIVFFLAVVLGLILDIVLPFNLFVFFANSIYQYIGSAMIILGSILIYWAQSSTSQSKKEMEIRGTPRNFARGPYKYSRNPTHIGLTIMTLGLAFVLGSLFSIVLTIISSLVTKAIFLKEEEAILEKEYGQAYTDYKQKVHSWI